MNSHDPHAMPEGRRVVPKTPGHRWAESLLEPVRGSANAGRSQIGELQGTPYPSSFLPALDESAGESGNTCLIEMRPASRQGTAGSRMSWWLSGR